ncbi:unnamed protein product [Soboliphyme baturini]|uniref:Transposase n=1 Tax=Soboliphyme baturini TaxID=241478 RepID=A0A183JA77_9BILA|nr:unnamed protein product [Soboliphyme baturini]
MITDVESEWQLFKRGVLEAAAEFCRYKRVGLPPGCQQKSSWLTRKVQLAVKEKKAAFKKWLRNKEPSSRVRYAEARKVAAIAVAKAKTDSWEKFGEVLESSFRTANKVFWQTIRQLMRTHLKRKA